MTRPHKPAEPPQPIFLTHGTLRARFGGVSRMWVPRRIEHDGFPPPVRFGNSSTRLWRLDLVEKWEADQIALGLAFPKKPTMGDDMR
jgi:predicted DNA-binding transcriptional regulator AlpA